MYWDDEYVSAEDRRIEVITDDGPTWTGLLDADGNKIVRIKHPIGFVRLK